MAQTATKKRKSTDGSDAATKKVKISKSADKPAPHKSALKKAVDKTEEKSKAVKTAKAVEPPREEKLKATGKVKKTIKVNGNSTQRSEAVSEIEDTDAQLGLTQDQTAALLAGFSSDSEDADSDAESGIPIASLPKVPSTTDIQKRIQTALTTKQVSSDPDSTPGVIYIGRIPHGFFEPQMRAYFSQFGEISNLRLARNKKTGASQHYAFVEFASGGVAEIVAKTMDKYLLFGHILQVRAVPREHVKESVFGRQQGRRVGKKPAPRNRLEGRKLRMGASREVWEKRVEMENRRREEKAAKLREIGYEFDMPAVQSVGEVPLRLGEAEDLVAGPSGDAEDAVLETPLPVETAAKAEDGAQSAVESAAQAESKKRANKAKAKGANKKIKV